MTKRIDSDALGVLNRSLGLTGAGSQLTELEDGIVDQTLSVNEIARRGRTLADVQGLYFPTLRNEHTDAESISTSIDPYNVGTTFAVAPYPAAIPAQFDLWLLGASIRVAGGTAGGFSLGTLSLQVGTRSAGFGRDDSGALVLSSQPIRLTVWNAMASDGTSFGIRASNRGPHGRYGLRLPRGGGGTTLLWRTVSTVTVDVDVQMILGMFPAALGQDGLV